jgi:MFS transporter, UMF1 family
MDEIETTETVVAIMETVAPGKLWRWTSKQTAWALYECARNQFYVFINIYVFAAYFTQVVVANSVKGQVLWGYTLSMAAVLIATLAPLCGALADAGGRRKPWIFACLVLAIPSSALLCLARPHMASGIAWVMAALIVANCGYELSSVFFNALLPRVAPKSRFGSVSGLAYAIANFACLVLFVLYLVVAHTATGILPQGKYYEERALALVVALWWVVFSLPLFLVVPDVEGAGKSAAAIIRTGITSLYHSIRTLRQHPAVADFLLARMVFNEGFIVLMMFQGVLAGGVLGWTAVQLSVMGLALSVAAVAGSFAGGWCDDHIGSRATLRLCIYGLMIGNIMLVFISPSSVMLVHVNPTPVGGGMFPRAADQAFFVVYALIAFAVTAGLVSSRAMLARLSPKDMLNKMFGLYSLSGTATSFMGPLAIAILTGVSGNQQTGIAAGLIFLVGGLLLLNRVKRDT